MLDLTKIDLLLNVGIAVAIFAIFGGVRGMYSVSASSRRDRTNQDTTILPVDVALRTSKPTGASTDKRRKAA
ncbi:MAG TPA: hypothetical protein VGG64_11040 [Pirellulales bacterium]|jgi:hypothetical protein